MMVRLLTTHLANDWRDIFPTIKVPTMILMGGKSYFASQLLWNWMKETIKGSKLEVIEEGVMITIHFTLKYLIDWLKDIFWIKIELYEV